MASKRPFGENRDNQGPQQQANDAQRQLAGQQNPQGETRQPQQQDKNRQQAQPGQQNQQADRERRPMKASKARTRGLKDGGIAGGNGDIRPGRTGDRGAKR